MHNWKLLWAKELLGGTENNHESPYSGWSVGCDFSWLFCRYKAGVCTTWPL